MYLIMETFNTKVKNILKELSDLDTDDSIALLSMIAELKQQEEESADSDYEPSDNSTSEEEYEDDSNYQEDIEINETSDGFYEIVDNILKSDNYKEYKKRCVKK